MEQLRGIIVLEGADATGKTTLARRLIQRFGGRYLHLGIHKNIWKWHLAATRLAVKLAETQLVVVDRLWLSEQAYGQAFRGGPAYDLGARCLDRVLQRHAALTVLCVRADLRRHLAHFEQLKGERPEKFDGISQVARLYADLARGDMTKAGATYLDQLTRYGDFAQRPDVMIYDMDKQGKSGLDQVTGVVAARLQGLMRGRPNGLRDFSRGNLVGGIQRPEFLFVGEALSPRAGTPWPFVWADWPSAATWLNGALHTLSFDETRALWTNFNNEDTWIRDVYELYPKIKIIALGGVANAGLIKEGMTPHAHVPHPQWHRRFRHQGGVLEYARLLHEAMR